jgi:hypothetical protein
VRYEVTGKPVANIACHCRDCQYVCGGNPSLSKVFDRPGFTLSTGSPKVYKARPDYGGSSFCGHCGVHVFSQPNSRPDLIAIKVGSLDDPSGFPVDADISMKSAPAWHRPHDGAKQIAGNVGT